MFLEECLTKHSRLDRISEKFLYIAINIYLNEIVVLTLCVTNYCIIVVGKLIKFEKRIFAYIALIL